MLNWFEKYFSFSRRELIGICTLGVLLLLLWLTPRFYHSLTSSQKDEDLSMHINDIERYLASIASGQEVAIGKKVVVSATADDHISEAEYFAFDPNGLPIVEWKRLGLSDRQIRVIKNYEAKGGRFRKKEDLKKIYSLNEADFARLEPYVHIKPIPGQGDEVAHESEREQWSPEIVDEKVSPPLMIDLNATDSLELQRLPGIGQVFASRIVRFRDRLGGFYEVLQLMDVYGFDSLRFNGLKALVYVDTAHVEKMALNAVDYDRLRNHPLISPKLANAIIQYRKQHGHYRSLEDLLGIAIMDEEIFRKIVPYLTISDD